MRVRRVAEPAIDGVAVEVLDDAGQPIDAIGDFMRYLAARGCSPNTQAAYAYDLVHFTHFLHAHELTYADFTPRWSLHLLAYLRTIPSRGRVRRRGLVLCDTRDGQSVTRLSPATINHILAAVSSFYDYLILAGHLPTTENPILKVEDPALARVADRHRPFMGPASRQRPLRRAVRVKTIARLPRPLSPEQVALLLGTFHRRRDRAMLLLMLQGGLRPGEALNLHLEDIQYGRRRVVVRCRTDHPKGVRTKSRRERVVDLHEPDTLATVSAYVMEERPRDTDATHLFLIGGHGARRHEPLGYDALARLFRRHCAAVGLNEAWITPHALRHTHATTMFEGGMRELTLQQRLGHASPESMRLYTRVSDPQVVADYRHALGLDTTP